MNTHNKRPGILKRLQSILAVLSILVGIWLPAGTAYASERDFEAWATPATVTGAQTTVVGVSIRNVSTIGNVTIQWIQFQVPTGITLLNVIPPTNWTYVQSGNVVTFQTKLSKDGISKGETGPGGTGDTFDFRVTPTCAGGTYTFSVLDVDDNNGTGSGQPWNLVGTPASVVVVPGSNCPVANNDSYTTDEDTPLVVSALNGVLSNDTPAGQVTATGATQPAHGTVTLNTDGSFTYTPNANFNGTDTFTYTATKGTDVSAPATVTITVNPVNDGPTANPDAYNATEDTPLTVTGPGVLTNDTDPENNPLTVAGHTDPSHGSLTINPDGSFTYTPNGNFCGTDSFTYWISDGSAQSSAVTVTITVACVNDPPVANDDSYSTNYATALTIAASGVLANDTDADAGTALETALTATKVSDPSHGTVTLNANGSFTYTPNSAYTGDDSFTYKANDGTANSNVATVTIHVGPMPPAPPAAADDSYTTAEDTDLTVSAPGILGNDSDPNGDSISAVQVSDVSHGTLTFNGDGSFTYKPAADYNGPDSFTYKVSDGALFSDVVTVHITVTPVNDPPVAVNDTYTTDEDTVLTVPVKGVLANDTDVDSASLTAIKLTDPAHGTVSLNNNGSFTYTPNPNYNGPDSFTYKANDGAADSAAATVNITINAVNDPPVAVNDSYSTDEDQTLTVGAAGVLSNDSDVEGDTLGAALVSNPSHGTVSLSPNGGFVYQPDADFYGTDTFTYKANDGQANSNVATVTITVNSVNDAPEAVDDSYTTAEDTALTVTAPGILANDTDTEDNSLTAVKVTNPAHGTVSLDVNGSFTYTPAANFHGTDSFTYKANDGAADSNVATVTITVTSVNDAPAPQEDGYTVDEDHTLTVDTPDGVLSNDSDADGDTLTVHHYTQPQHGTVDVNDDGSFVYTPDPDYCDTDYFEYWVTDGTAIVGPVNVSINIVCVNDPPVANNDSYTGSQDNPLTVTAPGVLGNDTDVDNDPLTATLVELVGTPAHGSVILNSDGSFTYTPNPGYVGSDSFKYKANDGQADSSEATVNINLDNVNDPPTAIDHSYTTAEDTALDVAVPGVLDGATDPDGDSLTVELVAGPAHGTLSLNANGSFTYTPATNYNGPDSFTYKAKDAALYSGVQTASITVTPVNDAPVAADDKHSTPEDTALTISAPGILSNDTDVDGNSLTAAKVTDPSHGTLTLNNDGSFTYTPAANYHGTDSFTYQANDGSADSNVATVTITIESVNDDPKANDDSYDTQEDTPLTIDAAGVLTNDTDVDGNPLTAVKVTNPSNGTVTLNSDGSFTYTPNANFTGTDTFTYKANDGTANSNVATVTINVGQQNDQPEATPDEYNGVEDTPLVIAAPGVLSNDSDPDGDTLTAVKVSNPTHGSVSLNPNGSFTYTPDPNFNGMDTFVYKAYDGALYSPETMVTIYIAPVWDAPVAVNDSYSTPFGTALSISAPGVLANDISVDSNNSEVPTILVLGPALWANKLSNPAHGNLIFNNDGSFLYTPSSGFSGTDTFTYQAVLGEIVSNVATVSITVGQGNLPPYVNNDLYTMSTNTVLTVGAPGVMSNDGDPEGAPITASLLTGPAHGTVILNANGGFSYVPAADYFGSDIFTYRVSDGVLSSTDGTVTINIFPNPVPPPSNASLSVTVATENDPAKGKGSVSLVGGGTVYYFYRFTNTGSTALTINSASDSVVGGISLSPTLLMPGQSATGSASKSFPALTPGTGAVTTPNTATVHSTSSTNLSVDRTAGASVTNQAPARRPEGSITVRVVDSTNRNPQSPAGAAKPMAGVPVQLGSLTGTTKANGEVAFSGLELGSYTASATANDPQNPANPPKSNSGSATITEAQLNETITLDFNWTEFYGPGAVTVVVLDGSTDLGGKKEPIKDAVVDLGGDLHGKTDAEGKITFSLDQGTYNMTVTAYDPKNRGGLKLQGTAQVVEVNPLADQTVEVVLQWAAAAAKETPTAPVETTGSLSGQICIPWPPGAELTAYGPNGEVQKITIPSDKDGRLGYMVDYSFPNLAVGQWRLVLSTPTAQGKLLEKTITVKPGSNPVSVFELVCTGQPAPAAPVAPWLFYLAGGALVTFGVTLRMRLRRKSANA